MENSGEDDTFAFITEEQTRALSNSTEPVISVSIGGVSRDMLIDSGSGSNLISMGTVQELKHQGLRLTSNLAQKSCMLMGAESLKSKVSFSQKFLCPKHRLWHISLWLKRGVVC